MKRIRILVAGALVAISGVVISPIGPVGTALAVCHGSSGFTVTSNGAKETLQSGTCNNDLEYRGLFDDNNNSDGFCVYIAYYKNGVWTNTGADCNAGSWSGYIFSDLNGDSSILLCKSGSTCSSTWSNFGF